MSQFNHPPEHARQLWEKDRDSMQQGVLRSTLLDVQIYYDSPYCDLVRCPGASRVQWCAIAGSRLRRKAAICSSATSNTVETAAQNRAVLLTLEVPTTPVREARPTITVMMVSIEENFRK
jgi:hypothetical protein